MFSCSSLSFFIRVKKFTYLDEFTMSTLRIRVCVSPDKTNFNSKSYVLILDYHTYLDSASDGANSYEEKNF